MICILSGKPGGSGCLRRRRTKPSANAWRRIPAVPAWCVCAGSRKRCRKPGRDDPMALRFVLDENLRGTPGRRSSTIIYRSRSDRCPSASEDPPDLPLGTKDPALLLWAEQADRIVRDGRPGHHHRTCWARSAGLHPTVCDSLTQRLRWRLALAAGRVSEGHGRPRRAGGPGRCSQSELPPAACNKGPSRSITPGIALSVQDAVQHLLFDQEGAHARDAARGVSLGPFASLICPEVLDFYRENQAEVDALRRERTSPSARTTRAEYPPSPGARCVCAAT